MTVVVQFWELGNVRRPAPIQVNLWYPPERRAYAKTMAQLERKLETMAARMRPRMLKGARTKRRHPEHAIEHLVGLADRAFDE